MNKDLNSFKDQIKTLEKDLGLKKKEDEPVIDK